MTQPIDLDDCAVVVIDMHRGHIGPDATIPAPQEDAARMLPTLRRFLDGARRLGIPVIHVRYEVVDGVHNAHPAWTDYDWAPKHCLAGDITTEWVVRPEPGDYVIETKRTYNCFAYTDLELYLKRLQRGTVVITGVATDCCCLATAFGANDLHYRVVAVADCQVGMTREAHDAALSMVGAVLGAVATADELIALAPTAT